MVVKKFLLLVLALATTITSLALLVGPTIVKAGESLYPIRSICQVWSPSRSNAPVPCDWTCVWDQCKGNDYEGPINHNGDGVSQKFTGAENMYKTFYLGAGNQTVNIRIWVWGSTQCYLGIQDAGVWQSWRANPYSWYNGWQEMNVYKDVTSSSINVVAGNEGGPNCYFDDFRMYWNPIPACSNQNPSSRTQVCYYERDTGKFRSEEADRTIGTPVTGSDTLIDRNWGSGNIGNSGRSDSINGTWKGQINFTDAYYTFHALSDDGVKASIDGVSLFNGYWDHGWQQFDSSKMRLSGNKNIVIDYYENGGSAALKFWWDREGIISCNPTPWSTPSDYSCQANNSSRNNPTGPNSNNQCVDNTEYRTVDTCSTLRGVTTGYFCSGTTCSRNCPIDSDGTKSIPPANSCAANNRSWIHHDYPATDVYNGACTPTDTTQYDTVDTCSTTPGQFCSGTSCMKNCPADSDGPKSTPPDYSCAANNRSWIHHDYPTSVAYNGTCTPSDTTQYDTVNTCSPHPGYFCSGTTCTTVPGAPTITRASCINANDAGSGTTVSWTNPAAPVTWVDVSPYSDFRNTAVYHKSVSGTSTNLTGFNGFASTSGPLTYNPYTTYYVRLYNGANSSGTSFNIDQCLSGACTPNTSSAYTEDDVVFTAYPTGGVAGGSYTYSWSAAEGVGLNGATTKAVTTRYSTTGNKTPRVTITSGSQTYTTPAGDPACTVNITGVGPFLKTTGGDVHSNKSISVPGGR